MISYTIEKTSMNHKEKCGEYDTSTIRTSSESHIYRKNHFHKSPLYFRVIADLEADNEIDNSNIGKKTATVYKQNPVCKG